MYSAEHAVAHTQHKGARLAMARVRCALDFLPTKYTLHGSGCSVRAPATHLRFHPWRPGPLSSPTRYRSCPQPLPPSNCTITPTVLLLLKLVSDCAPLVAVRLPSVPTTARLHLPGSIYSTLFRVDWGDQSAPTRRLSAYKAIY